MDMNQWSASKLNLFYISIPKEWCKWKNDNLILSNVYTTPSLQHYTELHEASTNSKGKTSLNYHSTD